MEKRRVVITGMGVVSSCGIGIENFWKSMKEGKSGISTIENFDTSKHLVTIGGEIKKTDFNPEDYMDPKDVKRTDPFTIYAVAAVQEAVNDSGLDKAGYDPYRVGVMMGTAAGGFHTTESSHIVMIDRGPTKCSPFTIPMLIVNMASGKISIRYGFKGPNKVVVSACATGTHCIGDAYRTIQYGDADAMVAGGCEASLSNLGVGGFTSLRALSRRNDAPEKASRPYDKDRDGFVMSDGAGVLILEEYEHAKARGAKIYAEIVGYGQTADAYDIVAPDPTGVGAKKCMELALKDANIEPKEIDYINPHGTSTGLGDKAEALAIAELFGDKTQNTNLAISATKSMHGHMLGATGAVESVICIKTILDGIVPPTINLDNKDDEIPDLDFVPHKSREKEVNYALTNSFGFGGQNATLVFKKI